MPVYIAACRDMRRLRNFENGYILLDELTARKQL